MRILVTGGTGFLGSHIVGGLLDADHEVRLLARTPAKVGSALSPWGGEERVEVFPGDVMDDEAVARALDGVDAVIHAANIYSIDPKRFERMHLVNTEGTRRVLGMAVDAGCDPVVHVSTLFALPPLASCDEAYPQSKVAAEAVAQELQDAGAPVVTTYPGCIWGPHDPNHGEMVEHVPAMLRHLGDLNMSGHLPIADVRWLARVHVALMTPGQGPRRVQVGGRFERWNDILRTLSAVSGRWLAPLFPTPRWLALALGRSFSTAAQVFGFRLPFSYANMFIIAFAEPPDDSVAEALVGPPPPLEDTVAAMLEWMAGEGIIASRLGARNPGDQ